MRIKFSLFLVKILYPTILANIDLNDLNGDFFVSNRSRSGTSRKLEVDDLQELLNENPSQTQELAKQVDRVIDSRQMRWEKYRSSESIT